MKKAVELCRHPTLAAAADKVHQLVHQDQDWLVGRKKLSNNIAPRRDTLLLVLL